MAGQSIGDRIIAAQHTIIGSDMSKSVCKATTSEVMGPKKKHLDYLHALTNEPNINIPELVDILVERSKQLKWVIVFKSLITTHHLMCYANEKFIQHLASRNSLFTLSSFLDKTGVQGYDMSTYIRRYAQYLNEKAISYRTVAYDFTRIKRGKDGILRSLDIDKLLKALPVLQQQLDALLEFNASSNELTNGVINAAFMLTFKDLIRLFACYNDGIINLLEKYFNMKKNQCKDALEVYKKFLTRMTKVSEMLKVAEQVGIDKGDIPDLTKAPSSLLDALEQHLSAMDGKKTDSKHSSSAAAHVSTLNALNTSLQKMDENTQQIALDEEKQRFEAFKKQNEEQKNQDHMFTPTTADSSFAQPQTTTSSTNSSDLLEIFGNSTMAASTSASSSFQSNNFATFHQSAVPMASQQPQSFAVAQQQPQSFAVAQQQPQSFAVAPQQPQVYGIGMQQPTTMQTQPFSMVSQQPQSFTNNGGQSWGATTQNGSGNMFGFDQVTPATQPNLFINSPFHNTATDSNLSAPGLLQPTVLGQEQSVPVQFLPQSQPSGSKDLESSLANVVANLTVGGQKANQDFEPKLEKKLTGGVNYMPGISPSPLTYNSSPIHTIGQAPGMVPQQRMPMYSGNMMGMMPAQQQPVFGMQYQQPYQQPQARALNPNNPFGSM